MHCLKVTRFHEWTPVIVLLSGLWKFYRGQFESLIHPLACEAFYHDVARKLSKMWPFDIDLASLQTKNPYRFLLFVNYSLMWYCNSKKKKKNQIIYPFTTSFLYNIFKNQIKVKFSLVSDGSEQIQHKWSSYYIWWEARDRMQRR